MRRPCFGGVVSNFIVAFGWHAVAFSGGEVGRFRGGSTSVVISGIRKGV